ncbi:hypothetical protein RJ53_01490 [Methanocalculus chunghsingensis]|uniref:Type II toxin-antitoxin system HicA family toxin n=1 Tax=Methanocalculus chunghsingensis TaxID=156457 RepID=A0A8J7W4T1_9EURY|nr:type II toxin-antitoxin system HicA family toxin [Methanocalculus chunghsingensis]MBR1368236.1 hypothetical protein [Methanocalculus chunghsingensis]
MPKLPRANALKHIAAFNRAGLVENHIEGSHHILVKSGSQIHLSIPVHSGKDLGIGLLRRLIEKAGMTHEEYCMYFSKKR